MWRRRWPAALGECVRSVEEAAVLEADGPLAADDDVAEELQAEQLRRLPELARLVATFLNHVKTSGLSAEALRRRARDAADPERSEAFLDLFEKVHARYEQLLGGEKDFHDLINHAAAHIRDGR